MHILLSGVVGSTAYGLATENSDVDMLGVYQAPTRDVLGLDGAKAVTESVVRHEPDVTFHELGKFASLALKANPTVLELLYLESYEVRSDVGLALIVARRSFLSTTAVRGAYGGYAVQQAQRLARRHGEGKVGFSSDLGKRTAKHGRHCFRLLLMGGELLATGELEVNQTPRRDTLFAMGELAVNDPIAFQERFEAELVRLDAIDSVLADTPDRERINNIVIEARANAL